MNEHEILAHVPSLLAAYDNITTRQVRHETCAQLTWSTNGSLWAQRDALWRERAQVVKLENKVRDRCIALKKDLGA